MDRVHGLGSGSSERRSEVGSARGVTGSDADDDDSRGNNSSSGTSTAVGDDQSVVEDVVFDSFSTPYPPPIPPPYHHHTTTLHVIFVTMVMRHFRLVFDSLPPIPLPYHYHTTTIPPPFHGGVSGMTRSVLILRTGCGDRTVWIFLDPHFLLLLLLLLHCSTLSFIRLFSLPRRWPVGGSFF